MVRQDSIFKIGTSLRKRGFTAIEVSAVATIIAILALVLIPIVRGRVEESRIVAAQDDMMSIEKAQSIVFATTGYYVRLYDLDNSRTAIPPAIWNRPAPTGSPLYVNFVAKWGGPYIAKHNTITADRMSLDFPQLLHSPDIGGLGGGPIMILDEDITNGRTYPLDPWGSPYLFFGNDPVGTLGGGGTDPSGPNTVNETNFGFPLIVCLGPNGSPGDIVGGVFNPQLYYRESGVIGTGDDLVRNF